MLSQTGHDSYYFSLLGVARASAVSTCAGMGLREGSTDWLANAFVGTSMKAYDASTAYSNPAWLDRSELDRTAGFVGPYGTFSGYNTNLPPVGGTVRGRPAPTSLRILHIPATRAREGPGVAGRMHGRMQRPCHNNLDLKSNVSHA